MKQIYTNAIAFAAICMVGLTATAQSLTPPQPDKLVDGKTYTMFNYCKLSNYLGRTSWDGAFTTWSADATNYLTFTAQTNENGTWSFYRDVEETVDEGTVTNRYYMNLPDGSSNINIKSQTQCDWVITNGTVAGFYYLEPSTGNNTDAFGYHAHLNGDGGYPVVSFDGNSFYPDFLGGRAKDADGNDLMKSMVGPEGEEYELYVMADSSSCNWGFVEVDNVQDFVAKAQGYQLINDFAAKYIADESYADYVDGFKATYDAAAAIYNGEEFFDEDVEAVKSLLSAKEAFYKELEKAELVEDADDVLLAAIANAKQAFKTQTSAESVAAAQATLAAAVENFALGAGDITSLGQNMSFEDLSSQGGSETSGVQGAPTGWNVYINGKQVVTADEVRSAGVSAWHGINSDSDGDAKDGNLAFGIWNSGIPQYEISQTIEGLENGTYTITAGLMVGANGSGSRRTTQRIFGNLNSTYFGSEFEYDLDLLAKDEVYAFQGNEELVTDRTLQPVEVKAYVYDGKLTFGLRTDNNIAAALRSSGNGAGGDGWFKLDNFRIVGNGYVAEDAVAVNDFFLNQLQTLLDDYDTKMYPNTRKAAETALQASQNVTTDSKQEDINAAIVGIQAVMSEAFDAAASYAKLSDAIVAAYENLETYSNKLGADKYGDVIMVTETAWNDEEYTSAEEVEAAIQNLADALQECIESDVVVEGMDLTAYIKNNSFEDWSETQSSDNTGGVEGAPKGWTLVLNGNEVKTAGDVSANGVSAWCAINRGDNINIDFDGEVYTKQPTDGDHLWGIWTENMPEVEIYQELHLPAGVYELTADMMVEHNWAGVNITTQRLFGNQSIQLWGRESDYAENFTRDILDAKTLQEYNTGNEVTYFSYAGYDNDVNGSYTSLLRPMSVKFRVDEDGIAKIGFRTNNVGAGGVVRPVNGAGWFKLDNFHLTCISLGAVSEPELPVAIQSVNQVEAADKTVYDVTGRRVAAPAKGFYIVNGKKVIVK